jgi:hypothetical protein
MAESLNARGASVERLRGSLPSTVVTDELNKILGLLRDACPRDALISFDFDGRLHANIDVRNREDVNLIETVLPTLGAGLFHGVNRGGTPGRPFHHRISATVSR